MKSTANSNTERAGVAVDALVRILLESGLKNHARNLKYDREGYSGPAWHPSEVCSGKPAVCAKWVTRKWVDESGINNMEWYGELDESITCDCGADEHNQRLQNVAKQIVEFIDPNEKGEARLPDSAASPSKKI
jgi:hypothetical protein